LVGGVNTGIMRKNLNRKLKEKVLNNLKVNKVLVVLGARRVGKTELIKDVIQELKASKQPELKFLLLNGEDEDTHELLKNRTVRNYERLLGQTRLLIIDEAQAIPDIGTKLKLMVDSIEGLKILVTGSSVFDLENKLGEPLVGRKKTFLMYPLAQLEFAEYENRIETKSKLEERLIFGAHPELEQLENSTDKVDYLKEQVNSYLLKDILAYEGIKKREKIISLLRIIAFRIGSEVSIEGIGNELQIGKNTVDKYLDLLSKVFIIHKVTGFSRNLDNEITKKSKWYFYDNGIRNALINNFNSLNLRNDQGQLWENYLISERLKYQEYLGEKSENFFWRTHTKQEIDWIEAQNGKLTATEFKWNQKKKPKVPALWSKAYPNTDYRVVNQENYLDFIT